MIKILNYFPMVAQKQVEPDFSQRLFNSLIFCDLASLREIFKPKPDKKL